MAYDLRHLRYFAAVAEELHFGRAAARLHIAQPALSRQIKQLEELIGATLLYRTSRTVKLTAAGKFFLAQTGSLLTDLEKASATARHVHEGHAGQLTLGFVASAAYTLLPPVLRAFRDAFP